jgi:hypothetical protein
VALQQLWLLAEYSADLVVIHTYKKNASSRNLDLSGQGWKGVSICDIPRSEIATGFFALA